MPVLEPPPAPGEQNEPEELTFVRVREEVRRQGNTEAVQALRMETRSRLAQMQTAWPSEWTYL